MSLSECSCTQNQTPNQTPNLNDFMVKSTKYPILDKDNKPTDVTFFQKTLAQPAVVCVGAGLGAGLLFAGLKLSKKLR